MGKKGPKKRRPKKRISRAPLPSPEQVLEVIGQVARERGEKSQERAARLFLKWQDEGIILKSWDTTNRKHWDRRGCDYAIIFPEMLEEIFPLDIKSSFAWKSDPRRLESPTSIPFTIRPQDSDEDLRDRFKALKRWGLKDARGGLGKLQLMQPPMEAALAHQMVRDALTRLSISTTPSGERFLEKFKEVREGVFRARLSQGGYDDLLIRIASDVPPPPGLRVFSVSKRGGYLTLFLGEQMELEEVEDKLKEHIGLLLERGFIPPRKSGLPRPHEEVSDKVAINPPPVMGKKRKGLSSAEGGRLRVTPSSTGRALAHRMLKMALLRLSVQTIIPGDRLLDKVTELGEGRFTVFVRKVGGRPSRLKTHVIKVVIRGGFPPPSGPTVLGTVSTSRRTILLNIGAQATVEEIVKRVRSDIEFILDRPSA